MNVQLSSRSFLPLGYYLLLGVILVLTRGSYLSPAVPVLGIALLVYALTAFFPVKTPRFTLGSRSSLLVISLSLVTFCGLLTILPNIIYPQSNLLYTYLHIALLITSFALGLFLLLIICRQLPEKASFRWFVFLLALFFYARFFVLSLSPTPFIDVFTTCSLACDFLLSGQNPYIQTYPDIYNGNYSKLSQEQFGSTYTIVTAMQYGPMYMYLAAPFRLLHDIRLTQIAADALTLGALWRLGFLLGWNTQARVLLSILWLVFPVSLFILEQAWTDPILIAALAWAFCFSLENKIVSLGIALGIACGIKHYGAVAVFFFMVHIARKGQFLAAFKMVFIAAAVLVSAQLPFLWLNAKALLDSTWFSVLAMPPRADSLSIWAWIWDHFGQPPLKSITFIVSAILIVAVSWNLWRSGPAIGNLARALALAFSILFFLGYQAFCNYYYFVAFLVFADLMFSLNRVERKKEQPVPA